MPKTVVVTTQGKSLLGFYRVNKKVLTVTSILGQKSKPLKGSDPEKSARHLLMEIIEDVRVK